jgi:hypothetical protein
MRYFIIFYMLNAYSSNNGYAVPIFGSTTLNDTNYPNKKVCENFLKREHNKDFVHIINVVEITQQDYESWIK